MSTAPHPPYADTMVEPGTTYHYKVATWSDGGAGELSDAVAAAAGSGGPVRSSAAAGWVGCAAGALPHPRRAGRRRLHPHLRQRSAGHAPPRRMAWTCWCGTELLDRSKVDGSAGLGRHVTVVVTGLAPGTYAVESARADEEDADIGRVRREPGGGDWAALTGRR